MMYDFVIKSKQIWVPPSKGRKGYYREDPREKHILDFLKSLLRKILVAKKKGFLTNEQRKYIRKSLKEVEPRMKYMKTQKQRMAVASVLKQIRMELKDLDKPKKKSGSLAKDELEELKVRGFTLKEIENLGVSSARAVIWNDIPRDEALGLKEKKEEESNVPV